MDGLRAAVGVAELLGAVGLVVATVTVSAFVDMALAWRILAVFMAIEGANRLRTQVDET